MKAYDINGCLALGMTPKEIAAALCVSIGYVYRQRRRLRAWEQRFVEMLLE
jgi:DNA-binding CsgD family transcriptional regulator